MSDDASKQPRPDEAEHDAFFPSPYSLSQYVAPTTDYDGPATDRQQGGPWKVLYLGTDERYVPTKNGRFFSTGNHPVETFVPLLHLEAAGFDIEVATLSGNPVKLEHWAMPDDDAHVKGLFDRLLPQLRAPAKLADLLDALLADDSPYLAVFIPGGHGAMQGLPDSPELGRLLRGMVASDRFVVTLCHGPAALLAAGCDHDGAFPFDGYEVCVFPDALDEGANVDMGYLPGRLTWLVAERLQEHGIVVRNDDISGQVHRDRTLLTGDSPMASDALGALAVETLLDAIARREAA